MRMAPSRACVPTADALPSSRSRLQYPARAESTTRLDIGEARKATHPPSSQARRSTSRSLLGFVRLPISVWRGNKVSAQLPSDRARERREVAVVERLQQRGE